MVWKDALEKAAKGLNAEYSIYRNTAGALSAAKEWAGKSGRVPVTGSFYTVEEAVGDAVI